jgi:hypothetical protein
MMPPMRRACFDYLPGHASGLRAQDEAVFLLAATFLIPSAERRASGASNRGTHHV